MVLPTKPPMTETVNVDHRLGGGFLLLHSSQAADAPMRPPTCLASMTFCATEDRTATMLELAHQTTGHTVHTFLVA